MTTDSFMTGTCLFFYASTVVNTARGTTKQPSLTKMEKKHE